MNENHHNLKLNFEIPYFIELLHFQQSYIDLNTVIFVETSENTNSSQNNNNNNNNSIKNRLQELKFIICNDTTQNIKNLEYVFENIINNPNYYINFHTLILNFAQIIYIDNNSDQAFSANVFFEKLKQLFDLWHNNKIKTYTNNNIFNNKKIKIIFEFYNEYTDIQKFIDLLMQQYPGFFETKTIQLSNTYAVGVQSTHFLFFLKFF